MPAVPRGRLKQQHKTCRELAWLTEATAQNPKLTHAATDHDIQTLLQWDIAFGASYCYLLLSGGGDRGETFAEHSHPFVNGTLLLTRKGDGTLGKLLKLPSEYVKADLEEADALERERVFLAIPGKKQLRRRELKCQ